MSIFAQVVDLENLQRSVQRAARGKRFTPEVAWFLFQQESRILELQRALTAETWRPAGYRLLRIREPKPRVIAVSPFADRVVHHAVADIIEPLLSRSYIAQSYACLLGRGTHRAVLAFRRHLQRHRFVMGLDLQKYFPSLPHARLLERLSERVRDERVLGLCARMLEADQGLYQHPLVSQHLGDPAFVPERERGVAVGSLMSQLYGNFYLDRLDHFIKRELKVKGYQRYLDNLSLFGSSRGELTRWKREIAGFVEEELGLRLSEKHGRIRPTTAVVLYLGHEVTRDWHRVGPLAMWRFRRRLVRMTKKRKVGPATLQHLERSCVSFRGMLLF